MGTKYSIFYGLFLASCLAHARTDFAPKADNPLVIRGLAELRKVGMAKTLRVQPNETFIATQVISDGDQSGTVKFRRLHDGIPVINDVEILHFDRRGNADTVKTSLTESIDITRAVHNISRELAEVTAIARVGPGARVRKPSQLVIYMSATVTTPILCWQAIIAPPSAEKLRADSLVYISVETGEVVALDTQTWIDPGVGGSIYENNSSTRSGAAPEPKSAFNPMDNPNLVDSVGTGKSFLSGNVSLHTGFFVSGGVYWFQDLTRGSQYVGLPQNNPYVSSQNTWGNNSLTGVLTVGADAAYGQTQAWDYFQSTFGLIGFGGRSGYSQIHYQVDPGQSWDNAQFAIDPYGAPTLAFGDGGSNDYPLVALDVVGHEYTHGVAHVAAGFPNDANAPNTQQGALDEGLANIFGTMVKFYTNDAYNPADYRFGSRISKTGTPITVFWQPSQYDGGIDCNYPGDTSQERHKLAGVVDHAFFLMTEGSFSSNTSPACKVTDTNVATRSVAFYGFGRDVAQQIWGRALQHYLLPTSNFSDARQATLDAARDIYGMHSSQYRDVDFGWLNANVSFPGATLLENLHNISYPLLDPSSYPSQLLTTFPVVIRGTNYGEAQSLINQYDINAPIGESYHMKIQAQCLTGRDGEMTDGYGCVYPVPYSCFGLQELPWVWTGNSWEADIKVWQNCTQPSLRIIMETAGVNYVLTLS